MRTIGQTGAGASRCRGTLPSRRRAAATLRALVAVSVITASCTASVNPATIDDAQTGARVKTALVNDPNIGGFTIEVHVRRGIVTLSGRVGSQAQVQRAVDVARGIAGVTRVESDLTVGAQPRSPSSADPAPAAAPKNGAADVDRGPSVFAVGAAIGRTVPTRDALRPRMAISPLFKFGAPQGLAPAIAFEWFQADLESIGTDVTLTRVHVKPVMVGLGYAFTKERLALTPSIVGGYAFNSLTVTGTGVASGLPVEVGNSLVWRVGANAWYDITHRIAINASAGYLMTGLRVTVLTGGRLEKRDLRGDTAVVHVGLAYALF